MSSLSLSDEYEDLKCSDYTPISTGPPNFQVSGLVWFLFVLLVVLIFAWVLISIGPKEKCEDVKKSTPKDTGNE